MVQPFKIHYTGYSGPWETVKGFETFALTILDESFPRSNIRTQKEWIYNRIVADIGDEVVNRIIISDPEFLMKIAKFNVGIHIYDQEVATMIKLAYS